MIPVQVKSIKFQGQNLNEYEVVDPDGGLLPPFEAGSHIDLYFRDGRRRQYSLCGDPKERSRYLFTVQRDPNGRGGSIAIFEKVHVGRILNISSPRNNFPLVRDARKHILIGGGIGITPLISMLYQLQAEGADFELYYCTRGPEVTAFREELAALECQERIHIHHDGGSPTRGLDFKRVIGAFTEGTHIYYCGPRGFMAAVADAAKDWPKANVHFELFQVPEQSNPANISNEDAINIGFRVKVHSTGREYVVPEDKTIVEVLAQNGIEISTSCEAGLCKSCIVRVISGEPDHRDYVLSEEEQKDYMLPCCSRSFSPLLVLDI